MRDESTSRDPRTLALEFAADLLEFSLRFYASKHDRRIAEQVIREFRQRIAAAAESETAHG